MPRSGAPFLPRFGRRLLAFPLRNAALSGTMGADAGGRRAGPAAGAGREGGRHAPGAGASYESTGDPAVSSERPLRCPRGIDVGVEPRLESPPVQDPVGLSIHRGRLRRVRGPRSRGRVVRGATLIGAPRLPIARDPRKAPG